MLNLCLKEKTKMSENNFVDQNCLDLMEDYECDGNRLSITIYNLSIYLANDPNKSYVNPTGNTPTKQVSGDITKINSLTIPSLDTTLKYTIDYSDSPDGPIKTLFQMYVHIKGHGNIQSQFSSSRSASLET
jgi:hypothetical protein